METEICKDTLWSMGLDGQGPLDTNKASLDQGIAIKHHCLKELMTNGQQVDGDDDELHALEMEKAQLSWQLLAESLQTYHRLVYMMEEKHGKWIAKNKAQLDYLQTYLETLGMKCETIIATCDQSLYGEDRQQKVLTFLSNTIDEKLDQTDKEIETLETRLEALKHLPKQLVQEYGELRAAITEKQEYIARLHE